MSNAQTIGDRLNQQKISRRDFLKFCTTLATTMGLSATWLPKIANALENAIRPSVVWLSFQDCMGCTESFSRTHAITLESLLFDYLSLDYHHLLQATAGDRAEAIRQQALEQDYFLIVEGSIALGNPGYSTIAGVSNVETLHEMAKNAQAIIAVGSCASFGGIAGASPNPTGAVAVSDLVTDKILIHVPGCPPIPTVITATIAYLIILRTLPVLDRLNRPFSLYKHTVHEHCPRRTFFNQGLFAESFNDIGAQKGWCLFKLGCRGPSTHNACTTAQWNAHTSSPIHAGHGCLGCSEPHFWDQGSFYQSLVELS
jgi:hydrogenase small subunit